MRRSTGRSDRPGSAAIAIKDGEAALFCFGNELLLQRQQGPIAQRWAGGVIADPPERAQLSGERATEGGSVSRAAVCREYELDRQVEQHL